MLLILKLLTPDDIFENHNLHRETFDIAEKYCKETFLMIWYLGTH